MPLLASDKGGSDFEPISAGTHQAVCYGVVDLGTQPTNNPQFAPARKVCIIWELPNERGMFADKADPNKKADRPRAISNIYTLSLGTKANLRKMLEAWRARPFTDEELKGFDLKNLIGANCMLSVIHKPGTGTNAGKVYANVNAVASLPKGMPKAKTENDPLFFSLDDFPAGNSVEFPANLPDWLKLKIGNSDELIERQQRHDPAPVGASSGGIDEDVPF